MKEEKRKLLSQVAYMHFVEGKNQSSIAKEVGIYRTTISRMIKQAKEEGIVEIQIRDFDSQIYALESHIKKTYGLQYITIVPTQHKQSEKEKNQNLRQEAANFLKQKIEPNTIVGVSWGSTLGKTIAAIETKKMTDTTFLPIVGGPSQINSKYHVNTLVYELAQKFGGESIFINTTVIQETKRLKDGILNSKYFFDIKQYWKSLDIAIVGIGGSLYTKDSQWRDFLTKEDYEDLKLREAVGDCCCRFFDKDGNILCGNLYDRTIGVDLDTLKKVPLVVSIARSKQKSKAILAVLKKRYINALITDEETIIEMLRVAKDPYLIVYEKQKNTTTFKELE